MRPARINSVKARVLTSDEISAEIKAKENKRKEEEIAKAERKRVGLEKKAAREQQKTVQNERREEKKRNANSQRTARNKKPTEEARTDYFEDLQNKLAACSSVDEMKTTLPHILPYSLNGSSPTPGMIRKCQKDLLTETLLQSMGIDDLYPLSVMADGNCLPRVASFLCWGTENKHVEMRVRIEYTKASTTNTCTWTMISLTERVLPGLPAPPMLMHNIQIASFREQNYQRN